MVVVETEPAGLNNDLLTLYYTKDSSVGNLPIVVFHGPSTTTNSTLNTSRIQAHIFSVAGFQSCPRLTISPTSSLYSAVHQLPEEDQGDEICRGLAVSLLKYFHEIPPSVKRYIQDTIARGSPAGSLFNAAHAARLACEMERVENSAQITSHLVAALSAKSVSWIDLDIILPADCVETEKTLALKDTTDDRQDASVDYGKYSELVEMLGSPSFIPTSRLRRAPSRPTGGKKSLAMSDEQIEVLKLDLQEVLDTERSYVSKIQDLTNVVSVLSMDDAALALPSNVEAIARSFSLCLSSILEANTNLLHRFEDSERGNEDSDALQDVTGTFSFARLFLEAIPTLRQPYIEYIRDSNTFIGILSDLLKGTTATHLQQIQEIGEQRLRSWLIEPIQRLPRYVLLLEAMVKKLPIVHPAVPKLLKAKDLISEILDTEEADTNYNAKVLKRLGNLVSDWPVDLSLGRLITAMDVVELHPPYSYSSMENGQTHSLLLLFSSHVMVLHKVPGSTLSARGLMAEIDRPSVAAAGIILPATLSHAYTFDLARTNFVEADNGRVIFLRSNKQASVPNCMSDGPDSLPVIIKSYALQGAYDGKAAKWSEEVARARIECRWTEKIRESNDWSLRSIPADKQHLGVVSAIFIDHDGDEHDSRSSSGAGIRVFVQDGTITKNQEDDEFSKEITGKIVLTSHSMYRLEFWKHGHNISTDNTRPVDFVNTFLRRLGNIQRSYHQPLDSTTAYTHVAINQKIAETIRPNPSFRLEMQSTRSRPVSPVKLLSNFLGGIRDQTTSNKASKLERSPSKQSIHSFKDMKPGLGLSLMNTFEPPKSQPITKLTSNDIDTAFAQLEKTLDTYVVALHSRCGNVVGKVIRNRGQADHVMVNELYNVLLEDPAQYQATAEVSVDVLFAAFENFLNHAWKDKMGPLLPGPVLIKLEHIFHTQSSSELRASFRSLAQEMTPQNQRAFSTLIKLVYDLLDASGNDGDRGAITAAFAEAIFPTDDDQKYISLLDRMVDNIDVLFDDVAVSESKPAAQFNSMGRRTKATTPGSISSVTSSFRKRFGFGKTQQDNSPVESESRVSQMIRNLSKKAAGESSSQPSSLSRSFLTRSKSIDDENRRPFFSRPGSSSGKEASKQSPTSHILPTITADNVPPLANAASYRTAPPKKKRRSSLSDITSLQNTAGPDFSTFIKPRPLETSVKPIVSPQSIRALPRTLAPTKLPSIHNTPMSPIEISSKIPSPVVVRKTSPLSSLKKENVPPPTITDRVAPKPRLLQASPGLGVPRKRDMTSSQIPSLKPGPSSPALVVAKRSILSPPSVSTPRHKVSSSPQRVTSLHRVSIAGPQRRTPSAQRLRMQSPQKLRERLEKEKKAIDQVSSSLQLGLKQIQENVVDDAQTPDALQERIKTLETKFTNTFRDLAKKNTDIQADLETSLVVSEKKAKGLDDAFRDANTENELIYEKFNGELLRVLEAVKSGAGLQEMRSKLREAQEEAARLRKENQRLKRENLGLKSQFR